MITKEEVRIAKEFWEQARLAAAYESAAWGVLERSRSDLTLSMSKLGFNSAEADAAFATYREDHRKRSAAALKIMMDREADYVEKKRLFEAQKL
ncbi:hypothetical protein [Pseudomonas sp. PS02288]|uniref:hypothetical protein n=1 Tax=Pseudomonas sp. PS02288 TaxID=2991443 RepID=UPI00249B34A0|nr:hypothetical protein [Pseudomonas sp. PS02288]